MTFTNILHLVLVDFVWMVIAAEFLLGVSIHRKSPAQL